MTLFLGRLFTIADLLCLISGAAHRFYQGSGIAAAGHHVDMGVFCCQVHHRFDARQSVKDGFNARRASGAGHAFYGQFDLPRRNAISRLDDRGDEFIGPDERWVEVYLGRFRGKIHRRFDARQFVQIFLDACGAGDACHPFYREVEMFHGAYVHYFPYLTLYYTPWGYIASPVFCILSWCWLELITKYGLTRDCSTNSVFEY